jgi:hypothetical protein
LATNIADFCEGAHMGFFYCDFRRPDSQDPVNIIGSLVAQLCCQTGWFPEILQQSFETKRNSSGQKDRPSFDDLKSGLHSFAKDSRIILLIDAIDECVNREALLNTICDLRNESEKISLLVTSRNESDINEILKCCSRLHLEDHVIEVDRDIGMYIETRLMTDRKLQWLEASMKAEIRTHLKTRSGGM